MLHSMYHVEMNDCDGFGLINYPKYIDWINTTMMKFFEKSDFSIYKLERMGVNIVTSKLVLDNKAACMEDDEIELTLIPDRLVKDGVFINYIARNKVTDTVVFEAHTELVTLDPDHKLIVFPEEVFYKLETIFEKKSF